MAERVNSLRVSDDQAAEAREGVRARKIAWHWFVFRDRPPDPYGALATCDGSPERLSSVR